MPRFFTHSRLGTIEVEDKAGQVFDDLAGAARAARQAGRQIASDEIFLGANEVDLELTIDNVSGDRLTTILVTATLTCTQSDKELETAT